MAERAIKLYPGLPDAVEAIHDGDRVAFGGFAVYNKAMALTHDHPAGLGTSPSSAWPTRSRWTCWSARAASTRWRPATWGLKVRPRENSAAPRRRASSNHRLLPSCIQLRTASAPVRRAWPSRPTYLLTAAATSASTNDKYTIPLPLTDHRAKTTRASARVTNPTRPSSRHVGGDRMGSLQTQPRRMNPQSVDVSVFAGLCRAGDRHGGLHECFNPHARETTRSPRTTAALPPHSVGHPPCPTQASPTMDLDVCLRRRAHPHPRALRGRLPDRGGLPDMCRQLRSTALSGFAHMHLRARGRDLAGEGAGKEWVSNERTLCVGRAFGSLDLGPRDRGRRGGLHRASPPARPPPPTSPASRWPPCDYGRRARPPT